VQHLAEYYRVRRVWLYGSLAEGGFHEHSDIDLAAEGFPPDSAPFCASAELDELARPFAVDLVPLEDARPSVRAHILQHGELLYDGPSGPRCSKLLAPESSSVRSCLKRPNGERSRRTDGPRPCLARPEALARVDARVREEGARLAQVAAALREALDQFGPEPQDRMHVHWVGGLLHDFYTGLEKAFSEVSPELNGESLSSETWHRDLLHTMTLDLPGFRPRVIRAESEPRLLELLKFRHLYRNLYSFDLRWERIRALAAATLAMWIDVKQDLLAFADALDAMARA